MLLRIELRCTLAIDTNESTKMETRGQMKSDVRTYHPVVITQEQEHGPHGRLHPFSHALGTERLRAGARNAGHGLSQTVRGLRTQRNT